MTLLRLAVFLLLLPAFCGRADARALLLVTVEAPPLVVVGADGSVGGSVCAVVREALGRVGLEARIEVVPWKRGLEMVRQGRADGIFAASVNSAREAYLLYAREPLLRARIVAIAEAARGYRMDRDGTGTDGLAAGRLRGGEHGEKLVAFLARARFVRVEELAQPRQAARMLLSRRLDVFLINDSILVDFQASAPPGRTLEIVRTPSGEPLVIDEISGHLAFSRRTVGEDVASRFSAALHGMKADGTYARLMHSAR